MTGGVFMPDWLEQRAHSSPQHPAVICEGRRLSYAHLRDRVVRVSGQLRVLGVGSGQRVALVVQNGIEFAEILHAIMRLRAIVVPLNVRLTTTEISQQLADCGPVLLCYDSAARDTVARLAAAVSVQRVCVAGESLDGDRHLSQIVPELSGDDAPVDLGAIHTIMYTSGSGGHPKGVLLTWANHLWSATGSAFNLGVQADDRWLGCLPLCHVGGLSILLRSVIYGTTAVIHDRFDAAAVNRAIDMERVTIVSAVANMLQRMLDERGSVAYPASLRCILLGGGPAPPALLDTCAARHLPVVQTYGLTEAASQVTTLTPRDAPRKRGSAGRVLLTTELRLVRGDVRVPAGGIGEIEVRGLTVSPGYVGDRPYPTRRDRWFATGDLGRLDDEGFLYVVGRQDDMIISGGENIYPAEVEAALEAHPAVAEACVVAQTDTQWGEIVTAAVRLRPGTSVSSSDLQAYVRCLIAGFKVPRQIRFVEDFPRTASGKILRQCVREER